MKKQRLYLRIFALLCAVSLLLPLSASAFAEGGTAAERGLEAIRATGDDKLIQLPKEESYLENFKTRYADISTLRDLKGRLVGGPCAPVDRFPNPQSGMQMPYAYNGTKVTVVAEEKNMSCILYRSNSNVLRAGWIWNIYLTDQYPGRELTSGAEHSLSGTHTVADVPMTATSGSFLTSQMGFQVLAETVKNCVGFTFDYQLIAENTDKRLSLLGPRTIYVNDGNDWVAVGSFDYSDPDLGPVRVQVNLDHPVNITAIGTIASCALPNTPYYREYAYDFIIKD